MSDNKVQHELELNRLRVRKFYQNHPERRRERDSKYRQKNQQILNERARTKYYENRESLSESRQLLKSEAIEAYGNDCSCCGETIREFLTIDHVNGRDGDKRTGYSLLKFLKKMGWPKDNYRLLCWNCNCGRAMNQGVCPHKKGNNGTPYPTHLPDMQPADDLLA